MFGFIKSWFKKNYKEVSLDEDNCVDKDYLESHYSKGRLVSIADPIKDEIVKNIDFSVYVDPIIVNKGKKPNILIVDDIEDTEFIYNIDFKNMKKKHGLDIYKDYEVIKCISEQAGFMAFDYVRRGNIIDYAILDITLENSIKLENGDYLEIDGIDIAIEILKHNKNAKIIFCTAHTMNKRNPMMSHYFKKYEKYIGDELMDHYLNKNGDRMSAIYKLLTGENHG